MLYNGLNCHSIFQENPLKGLPFLFFKDRKMPDDFFCPFPRKPQKRLVATHLERPKEEVKFPWFDIYWQTTDKQCSYLQTKSRAVFGQFIVTVVIYSIFQPLETKTCKMTFAHTHTLMRYAWPYSQNLSFLLNNKLHAK